MMFKHLKEDTKFFFKISPKFYGKKDFFYYILFPVAYIRFIFFMIIDRRKLR